jgi:AraC-like DNA-binding protein
VGPGALFITHPDLVFRCRHQDSCPDDVCLSLEFSPELVSENRRFLGSRNGPVVAPTARTEYWRQRITQSLDGPSPAAEAAALEALALMGREAPGRGWACAPEQTRWYHRRIDRARERLHHEYPGPVTLAALAREAGISSYHFVRVFHILVGLPPHRYLIRLRLDDATRRLEQGASVTQAAFAAGFENLSHFTRTFRRWYGVNPSRWMRLGRAERLRKKVQAPNSLR